MMKMAEAMVAVKVVKVVKTLKVHMEFTQHPLICPIPKTNGREGKDVG